MSDDPNENEGEPLDPRIREQLRTQERELKEAKSQIRTSELRAIYSELGIPDAGAGKLFRDTYPGEATVDAVRTAAGGYGDAVLPPVINDTRQDDLDALRRIQNASDPTGSPEAQDILAATLAKLHAAVNDRSKDPSDQLAEFDRIMDSAEVQALRHQPVNFN